MDKHQLRQELRNRLLEITNEQRLEKSKKACQNLLNTEEFQSASVIMIYLSLPHEIDTSTAILHAWQMDKTVSVPKVSWHQRHMIPVEINSLETGFSTDSGGLRNPITGVPVPLEEIDIIIAPGLGFDRKGNRLGRGGSYYDRLFANEQVKAVKCGIAFNEQLVDVVPMDENDVPMDILVTDEEVISLK